MTRLKRWLAKPALAPFAIPIFVAVPLWQINRLKLPYGDILPSVGVALALVGVLLLAVYAVQRNWQRAALVTLLWTAFLYYSPSLVSLVTQSELAQLLLIVVLAILAWDAGRRIPRDQDKLEHANFRANAAIVPAVIALACFVGGQLAFLASGRPEPQDVFEPFSGKATARSPDVWHIVMDRYGNTDTLARIYGYDNRPFLNALRERGFAVDENAHSNYQYTAPSLASTLNADHLDGMERHGAHGDDQVPLFDAVRENQALRFFRDQGYQTIFAGSRASVSIHSDIADRNINYRDWSIGPLMLGETLPGLIGRAVGAPFAEERAEQCLREKRKFAELNALAGQVGRKYVFAHFLIPHPPFALMADGSCRSAESEKSSSRAENYAGQLEYGNRELLQLIDAILAGPRPATIVLHADEGPYPAEIAIDELASDKLTGIEDWTRASRDKLREKTGILMAIRQADGNSAPAPASPVNIYPLILNRSFGGHMPMRADRILVFPHLGRMHDLVDVTDKVR